MTVWVIETTDREEMKATMDTEAKEKKEEKNKRERKRKKEQKRKERNAELRRRKKDREFAYYAEEIEYYEEERAALEEQYDDEQCAMYYRSYIEETLNDIRKRCTRRANQPGQEGTADGRRK
jgi:hypothetical protein